MLDSLKDIAIALTLAGVCAIGAWILRSRKQQILMTATDLIQKVENAVRGSGMGEDKKAKVVAQLEVMGVRVTSWLDRQIDKIVAYLNEKSAWFTDDAADMAEETIDEYTLTVNSNDSE